MFVSILKLCPKINPFSQKFTRLLEGGEVIKMHKKFGQPKNKVRQKFALHNSVCREFVSHLIK